MTGFPFWCELFLKRRFVNRVTKPKANQQPPSSSKQKRKRKFVLREHIAGCTDRVSGTSKSERKSSLPHTPSQQDGLEEELTNSVLKTNFSCPTPACGIPAPRTAPRLRRTLSTEHCFTQPSPYSQWHEVNPKQGTNALCITKSSLTQLVNMDHFSQLLKDDPIGFKGCVCVHVPSFSMCSRFPAAVSSGQPGTSGAHRVYTSLVCSSCHLHHS